ncbi:MAG: hypothetical protein ABFC96_11220 [Thermoguttaceae bacterium]
MPSPAVQPLLCLMAYPVGGNPTQYLIERVFAKHDLDWRYLTFEVRPEDLSDAVRGLRALGFRGAHCVGSHRQQVIPLLDRTTDTAGMIGSVNLIFRDGDALVGDNTEGKGLAAAIRAALATMPEREIERAGTEPTALTPAPAPATGEGSCNAGETPAAEALTPDPSATGARGGDNSGETEPKSETALTPGPSPATGEGRHGGGPAHAAREGKSVSSPTAVPRDGWAAGRRAVLFGAGQLARATAIELAAAGIAGLTIIDRTESRAAELASLLATTFGTPAETVAWSDGYAAPPDIDILINVTSLGDGADGMPPLRLDSLRADLLVVDAGRKPTQFLEKARDRGCPTVDGLAMFVEQIAISVQLWTGVDPDRQLLRDAAEEFLGL